MRRHDKKQNILEANRRLLGIDEQYEMECLFEEIKKDFNKSINTHELNEGFIMGSIGVALAGGKLLDLLGSGIKKLINWLVSKGIISKDGKVFNKTEKVSEWLKKSGEWWSKKILSFFKWVAGGLIKLYSFDPINQSKFEETKEKLGLILFYVTITSVGLSALSHLPHLSGLYKSIESTAVSIKGYEIGVAVSAVIMRMMIDELNKYKINDIIHTLESCIEDGSKLSKYKQNVNCVVEKISSHGKSDGEVSNTDNVETSSN